MDYSEQDIDDANVDLVQSETVQDLDYALETEDGEEQPEHEVQEEEVLNQEEGDSPQSASDDDDEFPGDHENSNQEEVEDAAGVDSDPNASGDDEEFPGNDEHSNQEEVETVAFDDSHPSGDEEFVENDEQSNQEELEDDAGGGTESEIIDESEIQDEMAEGGVSETVVDEEVVEDAYENQEEESFADEQPQEFEEGAYATQEDVTEEVEVPIQEEYVTEEHEIDNGQESPGEQDVAGEDSTALEGNQDVEEKVGSPPMEVGDNNDKKDESEEEDFDNVVEVEEQKAESDVEDENIAQHVSDSEDEDGKTDDVKLGDVSDDDLRGATSGSENEASDVEDTNISPVKKRTAIVSSDDEDGEAEKEKRTREKHEAAMKMFDSDSEDEQKEGVGELIADIFGESDDEGEEFTGFGAEEVGKQKSEKTKAPAISDSDEDEEYAAQDSDTAPKSTKKSKPAEDSDSDEGVKEGSTQGMSDFDIMLAQKKEENRKHRKRRDNSTFISDADDIINAMLTKMKEAAEADREANQKRKPALKKLKMLPTVVAHLKKQNLKELFVDNGVIAAIADWISLLPDRSLPHITIRTELLKVLHDMPSVGPDTLKHSGIGKAVMILFKHPKEARQNRDSAGRLINKWSRPIFGLNENFKSMSREEREQRDLEQMPQAKRRKLTGGVHGNQTDEARPENELGHLRPGEVGFVMRARVPMPSTKDYVVRPKWNVETEGRDDEDSDTPARVIKRRRSAGAPRSSKKDERLEKHMRNFAEVKKSSKMQRAVKISIEGNKMSIL